MLLCSSAGITSISVAKESNLRRAREEALAEVHAHRAQKQEEFMQYQQQVCSASCSLCIALAQHSLEWLYTHTFSLSHPMGISTASCGSNVVMLETVTDSYRLVLSLSLSLANQPMLFYFNSILATSKHISRSLLARQTKRSIKSHVNLKASAMRSFAFFSMLWLRLMHKCITFYHYSILDPPPLHMYLPSAFSLTLSHPHTLSHMKQPQPPLFGIASLRQE
jgi:hypothetical protein